MLEGTFEDCLVHFPAQRKANFEVRSTLLRALSRQALSISKDEDGKASLNNLLHHLTFLTEEFFPNIYSEFPPLQHQPIASQPFPLHLQEPVFATTTH